MTKHFMDMFILGAEVIMLIAMLLTLCRVLIGPRAQDRVVAFDALYVNAILLLLMLAIHTMNLLYIYIALVVALFGFVSTVAMAKFLFSGEVIE